MPDQPNEGRVNKGERLFIKVILPRQGAERKIPGGGTPPKPFRQVDNAFRASLSLRIKAIDTIVKQSAKKIGAVPAKVRLLPKAFAKSHRPETIFSSKTCPIIGAGKMGELFIKATSDGLNKIDALIADKKSDQILKEISTIETIEPITPEFRLSGLSANDILRSSPKIGDGYLTKIQLFDFEKAEEQKKLIGDFYEKCTEQQIEVSQVGYSKESNYFTALCKKASDINHLAEIVGIRSIKRMPIIKSIRPKSIGQIELPILPEPNGDLNGYPVVGIVDSGVTDKIPQLNKWIIGRESKVAPIYRNTIHGTFVGGLICWAKELNPDLNRVDSAPCAIFDLQVIPNDDPSFGEIDAVTEAQLLQDLEATLKAHANEIKVWNLSLGTDEICSLDDFSSFAVELDRLQVKYNIIFVISAGNYDSLPLLNYPRTETQLIDGRITTPADSILGITVGAIAHRSHADTGPREGEPSAFSRHGAGPNYIIKPDLVHYGGTCDVVRKEVFGIKSIYGDKIGESCGTSFSAPLVSRLLANIYYHITPTPSPVLARAILTHHAQDPRTGARVPDKEENFLGFGIPNSLINSLECSPWSSTLVFQDYLRPGYYLEWDNFPYPTSLTRKGRYYGDISMTVAFAPVKNERWGTEYCETHVEAHFGVWHRQKSRKTGTETIKFKGLVPPEHENPGMLYESYQVKMLRKWAPVRTYFGSLGAKGARGERWRLKIRLLTRHGIDADETMRPQPFALILTITDPNKQASVYNDMAVNIHNRFKTENLLLRTTAQIQVRQ